MTILVYPMEYLVAFIVGIVLVIVGVVKKLRETVERSFVTN
jgi:hypothetical protein